MADGLLDRTVGLSQALRRAGIPVSLAESLDAARTLGALQLTERETLRAGLAGYTEYAARVRYWLIPGVW